MKIGWGHTNDHEPKFDAETVCKRSDRRPRPLFSVFDLVVAE